MKALSNDAIFSLMQNKLPRLKKLAYAAAMMTLLLQLPGAATAKDTHYSNGQPVVEYETEFVNGQKVIKQRISGGDWDVISTTPLGNAGQSVVPASTPNPTIEDPVQVPQISEDRTDENFIVTFVRSMTTWISNIMRNLW